MFDDMFFCLFSLILLLLLMLFFVFYIVILGHNILPLGGNSFPQWNSSISMWIKNVARASFDIGACKRMGEIFLVNSSFKHFKPFLTAASVKFPMTSLTCEVTSFLASILYDAYHIITIVAYLAGLAVSVIKRFSARWKQRINRQIIMSVRIRRSFLNLSPSNLCNSLYF